MVRITPELVENAPQYTNAIKDRELDLRGYKFPVIENLGSTLDQFDTIDLSENEIRKLDGFPLLKRLRALILTNNKLIRLADDLGQQIPNLDTLILTGNSFSELRELEPLSTCKRLTFLSLLHCPVTTRSNYRLFVISRVPTIRFLDFRRVTNSERKLANSMFRRLPALSTPSQKPTPNRVVNGIARPQPPAVKTFVPGAPLNPTPADQKETSEASQPGVTNPAPAMPPPATPVQAGTKRPPTGGSTQDLFAIQEAIKRARTMEEVERLHQMLSSGQFAGFATYWQQLRQQQARQTQQQEQQGTQPSQTSEEQQGKPTENSQDQSMEVTSEAPTEQSATEAQPQAFAQATE